MNHTKEQWANDLDRVMIPLGDGSYRRVIVGNEESARQIVACVNASLSAAEKERDEALAYVEKLKNSIGQVLLWETLDNVEDRADQPYWPDVVTQCQESLSTPAPAALSHLRQEIRREVLLELAELMDRGAGMSAAGLRNLAEQEKQG